MFKRHFLTVDQLDEEVEKSYKSYRNLLSYDDADSSSEEGSRPSTRPSTAGMYSQHDNEHDDANILFSEEKFEEKTTISLDVPLSDAMCSAVNEVNKEDVQKEVEETAIVTDPALHGNDKEAKNATSKINPNVMPTNYGLPANDTTNSPLNIEPPRVAVTPTVRVATAAKSAIRVAELERIRRKKAAQQFVLDMRSRADTKKAKEDAQLRKTLLEHTYRWAIAERDRINMSQRGVWNGALVGDKVGTSTRGSMTMSGSLHSRDGSHDEFTSVPKFMADGLERLIRTASRSSNIDSREGGMHFPSTPLQPLSAGSLRGVSSRESIESNDRLMKHNRNGYSKGRSTKRSRGKKGAIREGVSKGKRRGNKK